MTKTCRRAVNSELMYDCIYMYNLRLSSDRHDDAIPDFEAVLKLDKDMAVAHVNLGLIYMLRHENYHRAVKKFTAALKADPTYVKAYVCRAEAYTRVHDVSLILGILCIVSHCTLYLLFPDTSNYSLTLVYAKI